MSSIVCVSDPTSVCWVSIMFVVLRILCGDLAPNSSHYLVS